ncbi:MAG: type I-E CRISPR-associated protein Cas6/Cse3/CasE [Proteobacteria bacterium]|jgi:CRISPR system Cascade subunit CasE|nr:type I-E CRISPR-associated protein Cas6/Cse3/CasE [Pseudomonadota bacterium]
MYLSKLKASPMSLDVQRVLANPYLLHQGLLQAFSPEIRGGGGRVLFRVEPQDPGDVVVVLVQSEPRPDWSRVAFWDRLALLSSECKDFEPKLSAGRRLRFRLRFNPTLQREGKRLPKLGEEAQRAWLARKLDAAGMELLGAVLVDEGKVAAVKRDVSSERKMTFLSVRADGALAVKDAVRAVAAIRAGIGPAKGLGFGLLSLARG